jgi:hypothetical protein
MKPSPLGTAFAAPTLVGFVLVIAQLRISALSAVSPIWQFAISFALIFPIAWLAVSRFGRGLVVFIAFIVGVALGVLTDVALDPNERNLFPIEVIWWWALLGPGCAVGAIVGSALRRHKGNGPRASRPS